MNKLNIMNRLKGFPLSLEQKQELLSIIEENGGGGGNSNEVKVSIIINVDTEDVIEVIVNDKQFTIENFVTTDNGDGFIIYNAELVDYLNSISRINIVDISATGPVYFIPLAYMYTSNRIDIIIVGTLFDKSTWSFQFVKP